MFTLETALTLVRHMEWADATVWNAVLDAPDAVGDDAVREKLYHVHAVQQAFTRVWQGRPVDVPHPGAFASMQNLARWGRGASRELIEVVEATPVDGFVRPVAIPWSRHFETMIGRELSVASMGDTVCQVTAHSTYHRGQINARLRAAGVTPPLTDYIAWVWLGKPVADWEALPVSW